MAEHMAKAKQMHSQAMVENRHQQLKQARESAGRIADLEEQLGRHREALAELASQAEGLANDNSLLSTEVATLRDQKALLEEQVAAVEERSKSLQTMYLAQLEDYRRTVTAHDARRDRILDGLATKEVLALSKPPGELRPAAATLLKPTRGPPASPYFPPSPSRQRTTPSPWVRLQWT